MSSEKISYVIFFVVALAIVSVAIMVERPESLASAIPGIAQDESTTESDNEDSEQTGDSQDQTDNSDIAQTGSEGPQGDGDGETNDDVNATTSAPEGPQGDGDGETDDDG